VIDVSSQQIRYLYLTHQLKTGTNSVLKKLCSLVLRIQNNWEVHKSSDLEGVTCYGADYMLVLAVTAEAAANISYFIHIPLLFLKCVSNAI
jgi:hypothetical protein